MQIKHPLIFATGRAFILKLVSTALRGNAYALFFKVFRYGFPRRSMGIRAAEVTGRDHLLRFGGSKPESTGPLTGCSVLSEDGARRLPMFFFTR